MKYNDLIKNTKKHHEALNLLWALIGKENLCLLDQTNNICFDIPDYTTWPIKSLKTRLNLLNKDIDAAAKIVLKTDFKKERGKKIQWLSENYSLWRQNNNPIWNLGYVNHIEKCIGELNHREQIECPLYAHVLLQGFYGAAIRHPEYHLARDLELFNNLYFNNIDQEKQILDDEAMQSLGRCIVLICFNLLEAFVNGLIAEHDLKCNNALDEKCIRLNRPEKTRNYLAARFFDVTCILSDNDKAIEDVKSNYDYIFSEIKELRNSYVHCVPSSLASNRGKKKEQLFYTTDSETIGKTVNSTILIIKNSWKQIYKKDGPRWLSNYQNFRFQDKYAGVKITE